MWCVLNRGSLGVVSWWSLVLVFGCWLAYTTCCMTSSVVCCLLTRRCWFCGLFAAVCCCLVVIVCCGLVFVDC